MHQNQITREKILEVENLRVIFGYKEVLVRFDVLEKFKFLVDFDKKFKDKMSFYRSFSVNVVTTRLKFRNLLFKFN
jgi:hypothetical protein